MTNVTLLTNIVTWAVQDYLAREHLAERITEPKIEGWGSWHQGSWAVAYDQQNRDVCNSAFCIAGQAAVQGHDKVLLLDSGLGAEMVADRSNFPHLGQARTLVSADQWQDIEDLSGYESIEEYAYEVLDITSDTSLFDGSNSINEVVTFAALAAWETDGSVLPYPDYVAEFIDWDWVEDRSDTAELMESYGLVQV
jgi:hypothetical protein